MHAIICSLIRVTSCRFQELGQILFGLKMITYIVRIAFKFSVI